MRAPVVTVDRPPCELVTELQGTALRGTCTCGGWASAAYQVLTPLDQGEAEAELARAYAVSYHRGRVNTGSRFD